MCGKWRLYIVFIKLYWQRKPTYIGKWIIQYSYICNAYLCHLTAVKSMHDNNQGVTELGENGTRRKRNWAKKHSPNSVFAKFRFRPVPFSPNSVFAEFRFRPIPFSPNSVFAQFRWTENIIKISVVLTSNVK